MIWLGFYVKIYPKNNNPFTKHTTTQVHLRLFAIILTILRQIKHPKYIIWGVCVLRIIYLVR